MLPVVSIETYETVVVEEQRNKEKIFETITEIEEENPVVGGLIQNVQLYMKSPKARATTIIMLVRLYKMLKNQAEIDELNAGKAA